MRLSSSIFTTGCHKHRFFICLLVSLWTHLSVVCGNDRPCTVCLILSRLCWCLMLIHILVLSSAFPWLTHILFVEPIRKLPLLHVAQPCACCKCKALFPICSLALVVSFYWFWGSYDPILCTLCSNTKILMCAQITGSFSSFFRTLLCSYHNILYSCGS